MMSLRSIVIVCITLSLSQINSKQSPNAFVMAFLISSCNNIKLKRQERDIEEKDNAFAFQS